MFSYDVISIVQPIAYDCLHIFFHQFALSCLAFPLFFYSIFFQSRGGKEVWVGPKTLPSGLPHSNVPERITALVDASKSPDDDDDKSAFFRAAKHIAKDCQYDLKVM